jgi:two-component system chemotaxis response regulator CheB
LNAVAGAGPSDSPFGLVVVLASLGGLTALSTLLSDLPGSFGTPMIVLQHAPGGDDAQRLAGLLRRRTMLPVHPLITGATPTAPGVSLVPGGRTVAFYPGGRCRLIEADPFGGGDALFAGAAAALGPGLIGVVLTGMLRDGSEGVRAVKRHGGRVLTEEPATARAGGMPSAAIATGCVDFVLPLAHIAPALVALTMAPGAAELFTVPTPHWPRLG